MKIEYVILVILVLILTKSKSIMSALGYPLKEMILRMDSQGSGKYGASRSGGTRKHNGTDFVVREGDPVFAPFDGVVTRQAYPYDNDRFYTGLHLRTLDGKTNMKIFYMKPLSAIIGKEVKKGDVIGKAQDISKKWSPKMKPHIHVEIWDTTSNTTSDPQKYFGLSPI
jgi:murein DD-endopeptidase MepM/ murein hydrolase activator NlpD